MLLVPGYQKFKFGSDTYDLSTVSVRKKWGVGVYFGIVVDTYVAVSILKNAFN